MRVHQKELKWLSYKNKNKIEMGESTPKRIGVAELRTKRKKRREWVGSYQENEMKRGRGGGCKKKKPEK